MPAPRRRATRQTPSGDSVAGWRRTARNSPRTPSRCPPCSTKTRGVERPRSFLPSYGMRSGATRPRGLRGLTAVDVGCSAGFIADELAGAGADTYGVDIDEPGLQAATARFGERVQFRLARGEALPFDTGSVDVVVLNHIYEHVVDPEAVATDIRRVLAPDGVVYLGLGNRLGVIEPHYGLPLLSWLPPQLADRYVRATGRGDSYYERFRARPGLRRLFAAFDLWDYTLPVLADPAAFHGEDVVPGVVGTPPRFGPGGDSATGADVRLGGLRPTAPACGPEAAGATAAPLVRPSGASATADDAARPALGRRCGSVALAALMNGPHGPSERAGGTCRILQGRIARFDLGSSVS